jgi:hypothetical protein
MHGAMAFFVFVFIMCQIIVVIISGGGMGVTHLTANITVVDVTLNVATTANFLSATPGIPAYLLIVGDGNKEVVSYTGKTATQFTGLTRNVEDPQTGEQYESVAFSANSKVMTTNIGAVDSFMGYNVGGAQGVVGTIKVIIVSGIAILRNIPRMLVWDYPWFQGPTSIFRYPLFAISAGFVWSIAMLFLQLAQGILKI